MKRFRLRKLLNGKFVGEMRDGWFGEWFGLDATEKGYRWPLGHTRYRQCVCASEAEAIEILAASGCGNEDLK